MRSIVVRWARTVAVLILATAVTSASDLRTEPLGSEAGRTFYVDKKNGSDANSGRSPSKAWKTLGKVRAASFDPGDTIRFRRDRTWYGTLRITDSGTTDDPITLAPYGTGKRPKFKGANSCVDLQGSHIHAKKLKAVACDWAGFRIEGDHVRLTYSSAKHSSVGIVVRPPSTRAVVKHNLVEDNDRMHVLTKGGTDDSGAFGILLQGHRTEVAFNRISGHDAFSYDYGRDGAAVEVYGATENHIHHNVAIDNHAFTELGNPTSADNTFAYNVVRSSLKNSSFLITRGAESGWGPILGTNVYNNTVHMTGRGTQGFVCHAGCGPDILRMRNNIIKAVWKDGYADAPFDGNHNLYGGDMQQFSLGSHDLVTHPRFMGPPSLRLKASSPAVDAGIDLGYAFDVRARPIVGAPDLGAHERQS